MKKTCICLAIIITIIGTCLLSGCEYDEYASSSSTTMTTLPPKETTSTSTSTAAVSKEEEKIAVFTTTTELNIRAGVGTSYDVIYVSKNGEQLEMTGNEQQSSNGSTWYEVKTPNGTGWCSGKYGTVEDGVVKDNNNDAASTASTEEVLSKTKAIEKALSTLILHEDEIEQIKWYAPSVFPEYKNKRTYVLPYIAEKNNKYYLIIKYNYYGSDYIGWDRLVFAVDDDRYEKKPSIFSIDREFDNSFNSCETYADTSPKDDDISILRKIVDSEKTIIRFDGDGGKKYDHTVSSDDKNAIKTVLDAYDVLSKYQ